MCTYKVVNVGQGDCMIIDPDEGCTYQGEKIIIDLGSGDRDITELLSDDDRLHIFITHSHKDHLGGLRYLIGKFDQIEEITVPLYQNEIILIAKAILNLKGISTSVDCKDFIDNLNDIVNYQSILIQQIRNQKATPILSFAYEGKRYCNHLECLNPPLTVNSCDILNSSNDSALRNLMYDLFTESFARDMEIYLHAQMHEDYNNSNAPFFHDFWLMTSENDNFESSVYISKCNFVLNFFIDNLELLKMFNVNSNRKNLRKIHSRYIKSSHDVCTVLRSDYSGITMLHTGDASKNVFYRLLEEGKDISASCLKMPHHGSKNNMNKRILNNIDPEVAIISHNNKQFGKAKDKHPHKEILNMLLERKIRVVVTNDVVREDITIMKSSPCDEFDCIKIL
ncbi:MAG: MBL fold metallo-hydrolase [Ruminococcus sp.]|nr:MBL fold metallo-hydrolase [Ruminococcus sp.]